MKTKIFLSIVISAVVPFSVNASDLASAQEAVAHAQRMADAAQANVDSVNANYGHGSVAGWAAAANEAGALRSQSLSDLNAAQQNLSNAEAQAKLNSYGVKTNPVGNPVISSVVAKTETSTINVNASTLNPNTKITTKDGVITAGALPKDTQVTVSFNSAFNTPVKGGNDRSTSRNYGEHGTGNGGNNAAGTHSAHGLGGNEHIGGGRSGGGFHY